MQSSAVKILGSKRSQRYAIARVLMQAILFFEKDHPEYELDITRATTPREILKYAPVFAYSSLMVGDKVVFVGRFPSKAKILGWLEMEIQSV